MKLSSKRICIDVRLLARGGASGIPEYTKNIVDALLKHDTKNQYILYYGGFRKEPLPDTWTKQSNVTVVGGRVPNRITNGITRLINRPFIDAHSQADVVLSPHFSLIGIKNKPHIVTLHDLSFIHHPYFFSKKQRFWHWLQDYKERLRNAHHVVAVSEYTRRDAINLLNIDPDRITTIYSGINPQFRKLATSDVEAYRTKRKLAFPFVLYLGTLEPRKNVEAIIRAFTMVKKQSRSSDLQLVIAGRPGWLYHSILKEAQTSPYRDHIIFLNAVTDEERVLLYNAASVFVFPSFFEGFGFPPLEAQASGTPVVVSDRTSLPEIVGSEALTIDPWQPATLADAILKVLTDKKTRSMLIAEGFKNTERFSWDETARMTAELLYHA